MSKELKPSAWIVIECGCRGPDDCEDYEVLVSVEDIGNYQKHIDHGRAYPLYDSPPSITKADVDEYCKANGMVLVPDKDIRSLLIHSKRLADDIDTDTSVNMDYAIEQIEDTIAAYKVQAL